jgi:hypothetical protein
MREARAARLFNTERGKVRGVCSARWQDNNAQQGLNPSSSPITPCAFASTMTRPQLPLRYANPKIKRIGVLFDSLLLHVSGYSRKSSRVATPSAGQISDAPLPGKGDSCACN